MVDLWLTLALSGSLWLTLARCPAHSGPLWLSLACSLALYGSLLLPIALSGSLLLSEFAYKAQLAAALLRCITFCWSGTWQCPSENLNVSVLPINQIDDNPEDQSEAYEEVKFYFVGIIALSNNHHILVLVILERLLLLPKKIC